MTSRKRSTAPLFAVLMAVAALVLTACGGSNDDDASGKITIFAAASLQGSFDDLAKAFTDAEPDYQVAPIVYDGSQALAKQIVEGADVDVIAFANESSLSPVTEAGLSGTGDVFATNTLQIAVPPGNPKRIRTLGDLARSDVTTVLCAPEVPCGSASQKLLAAVDVSVTPVSQETNVTSVVTRVANGEADAGLVYATDVAASDGRLEGITPPNAGDAVNRYPIAVPEDAPSPEAAEAFRDFVLSAAGQKILRQYGFGPA
ncbi:molybdate ABC transporter substrate-binding protein [Gordonia sp. HY002]|uniref:molybdate ABC transporter substrate-binding protein n=1 Tax=Gordonia zhenghanii TaxID=2911516 RepID=UPI001EF0C4FD|nr:molybdate ABC transporter substrate-binding protein [Gordonia zhenghanii]MCF8571767.1 molybdate ABC transporter substrate-binding protein [Gordonia zhenghanii]MCF8604908.1 molybdate ABC transporter substrate-binding protein [Gordonia zhenghanii]